MIWPWATISNGSRMSLSHTGGGRKKIRSGSSTRHMGASADIPTIFAGHGLITVYWGEGPNENGVKANLNIALRNCACASVDFPKTSNQPTYFDNPVPESLQLKIANRFIPPKAFSTASPRFLQEQLMLSELDGGPQPTSELNNSVILERNDPNTGLRHANTISDAASLFGPGALF